MTPLTPGLIAAVALIALAATNWLRYAAPVPGGHRAPRGWRPAVTAVYAGATEDWSPLATVGAEGYSHDLDPAPNLIATHAELATVGDAIAEFGERVDAVLAEFIKPLDAETTGRLLRAREWASDPDTGAFDVRELRALLALDDLEPARA